MKREKNPKQYIFICNGKDCLKNGARELQQGIEKTLKGNKKNCCLVKTKCMDHCKDGPSVVIDNVWHGRVSSRDLHGILAKKAVI